MKKENVLESEIYWFVFVPVTGINLQTVRLERLFVEHIKDGEPLFKIIRGEGDNEFLSVGIVLEEHDYDRLFEFNNKAAAERRWTKEFFKHFKKINGIEIAEFISHYKQLESENPEWLI